MAFSFHFVSFFLEAYHSVRDTPPMKRAFITASGICTIKYHATVIHPFIGPFFHSLEEQISLSPSSFFLSS